ncbi:hydroxyacylglutathione hydrolase [Pseudomonas aeruginosa]|uniref:hydroxyacylglutathione hydrolase n=1 Tax=Pseudomonas aeruginosa TaxID=287 RepID=UPI000EAB6CF4|nr:hydroxyacylglutathione hydrolase [Pseudomonas aeruginosa]NNB83818.1 hydroxyacylglutathione hydrolase [Pseudomonas aeruginosa]
MFVVPIPAFMDNYIWALHDGKTAIVVDPGMAAPVEAFLRENQLVLGGILITHHHDDHQGGVAELLASRASGMGQSIPVVGPAAETIQGCTYAVREGSTVVFTAPKLALKVLEVPGHTAGHVAYFGDVAGNVLFCGDTLFASGCGRLFEGTAAQMHASLQRLAALPGDTRVYCAHEYTEPNVHFARTVEPENPDLIEWERCVQELRKAGRPTLPTTLTHELRVNPFLRVDETTVREALCSHYGKQGKLESAKAFELLRSWKDGFS